MNFKWDWFYYRYSNNNNNNGGWHLPSGCNGWKIIWNPCVCMLRYIINVVVISVVVIIVAVVICQKCQRVNKLSSSCFRTSLAKHFMCVNCYFKILSHCVKLRFYFLSFSSTFFFLNFISFYGKRCWLFFLFVFHSFWFHTVAIYTYIRILFHEFLFVISILKNNYIF